MCFQDLKSKVESVIEGMLLFKRTVKKKKTVDMADNVKCQHVRSNLH